ncbi:MAG: hypothetical protein LBE67_11715 [Kocuria palustris]|nr:hypothetical protein [Kocuria palustris]
MRPAPADGAPDPDGTPSARRGAIVVLARERAGWTERTVCVTDTMTTTSTSRSSPA